MSKKLEKLLEYLLSNDQKKAKALLHQVFIEKAKKIHEDIMNREDDEFDTIGGDEGDSLEHDVRGHSKRLKGLSNEIETEETMYEDEDSDMEFGDADADLGDADEDLGDAESDFDAGDSEDADFDIDSAEGDIDDAEGDIDAGQDDVDFGGDDMIDMDDADDADGEENSIEDTIGDLEDALAELKAEFERLEADTSDEDGDEDVDGDVDVDVSSDEDGEGDVDVDVDVDSDDSEDMDESWFSENYDELDEAIELDRVTVDKSGEVGSGKFSSDIGTDAKSPVAKSQTNRMGATPVKIDDKKKNGFDRESAPSSKDMGMTNRRKKAMDGMSKVSKEGNPAALINKTNSEFGVDTVGKNSPLSKSPRK